MALKSKEPQEEPIVEQISFDDIDFEAEFIDEDELDEIGIYNIQFHFYDNEDNRITIPPVQFEVKELLGVIKEEA